MDLVSIEDRSKLTTNYKEYVRNTLSGKDFLKEVKWGSLSKSLYLINS